MKHIKNIIEALNSDFTDKKDVTYFLVEIGKTLEIDNNNKKYETLSFYRNWSVHSKINDLKNYKNFFNRIDNEVQEYLKFPDSGTRRIINNEIETFFSFEKLKFDLDKLLFQYSLPQDLTKNTNKWKNFVKNLREIILEVPIEIKNISKSIPNSKIRFFHLTKNPLIMPANLTGIAWQIWIETSNYPLTGYLSETLE